MPKLRPVLCCALLLLGVGLAPQPAAACSQVAPEPFVIDPELAQSDSSAPTPFREITASTHRITGEHCKNGTCISTSCGDLGYVELRFEPPSDGADSENAELGYKVVWLSGKLPESMRSEIGVVRPLNAGGSLTLDVGYGGITELDGELALVAVDRAGNESEPSEAVHVQWSGCTYYFDDRQCSPDGICNEPVCAAVSGNCALAAPSSPTRGGLWLWMSAVVLGLCLRRSRHGNHKEAVRR